MDAKTLDEMEVEAGVLVEQQWACPHCGNRVADDLVWQDDDTVQCQVCGTVYVPA